MKNKVFIGVVGISILAFGGWAMLQKATPNDVSYTPPVPTPTPTTPSTEFEKLSFPGNTLNTSDWLTYRNEELEFEVRYPKDWEVIYRKGVCSSAGYGIGYIVLQPKNGEQESGISICATQNNEWEKYIQESAQMGWYIKEKVQVNNAQGIVFARRSESDQWLPGNSYKIVGKEVFYRFDGTGGNPTHVATFEQILLSFRLFP